MKNNKRYTNFLLYIFLLIIGSSFKMISNSQLNESNPIEDTVHQLQRAVLENNQTEIVRILNESKISIDTYAVYKDDKVLNQNAVMWTPMGIACIKGDLDMVKFLIEQGASIEEGYYDEWFGYSSLFAAVEGRNYHVVEFLLEKKVNPNQGTYENGFTALIIAIQNNDLKMCELLLKNGMSPDKNESSFPDVIPWIPLELADNNKYTEIVQLLLRYHAETKVYHGEPRKLIYKYRN